MSEMAAVHHPLATMLFIHRHIFPTAFCRRGASMKINGPLPPSHSYVPTFDPPPRFSPFLPLGKTVATYREGVKWRETPSLDSISL